MTKDENQGLIDYVKPPNFLREMTGYLSQRRGGYFSHSDIPYSFSLESGTGTRLKGGGCQNRGEKTERLSFFKPKATSNFQFCNARRQNWEGSPQM